MQEGGKSARSVLLLSSLCIPIGLLVTALCCWFFGPDEAEKAVKGYEVAILLQGKPHLPYSLIRTLSVYPTSLPSRKAFSLARWNGFASWQQFCELSECMIWIWCKLFAALGQIWACLSAGIAAMIELFSEPLYILAMVQHKIRLRVIIEATATIAKVLATLAFLWTDIFAEAIALSLAQVMSFWKLSLH